MLHFPLLFTQLRKQTTKNNQYRIHFFHNQLMKNRSNMVNCFKAWNSNPAVVTRTKTSLIDRVCEKPQLMHWISDTNQLILNRCIRGMAFLWPWGKAPLDQTKLTTFSVWQLNFIYHMLFFQQKKRKVQCVTDRYTFWSINGF